MTTFLIRIVVALGAAAIGLIVAAVVFDRVDVAVLGLIVVAAIYALAAGLVTPALERQVDRSSTVVSGAIGLGATFVALLVTDIVSDDLSIEGVGTWIGATVIVWVATLVASLVLTPVVTRLVDERRRRP